MRPVLEMICRYFDDHSVPYRRIEHQRAASADEYHAVLGTRYEQQAKALFVRYKRTGEKGFVVLAIQAQKRADMSRLGRLLEARDVRLGTSEQLREVTGCEFGELPPVARPFGLQLVLDKDLLNENEIYFNAGDLETSIAIDPKAIDELEAPILY